VNTDKDLTANFCKKVDSLHNWQTKILEVVAVNYVISNLLKDNFVVEIDGHKYDITFGKNRKHYIGTFVSLYPSPVLSSYEIINKGFTTGKWYRVTDVDLSKEEIDNHIQAVKNQEERKHQEWILEIMKRFSDEELENFKTLINQND